MPYFNYDDKRMFYRDEGKGEVILLLPGNTASSAVNQSEIEYFSKSYRVICPDYIGYGKSDRVRNLPTDFWWIAAEMSLELLNYLNIEQCIAIGTSGGGIIALNTAIISPDIVRCVVSDSIPGEFLDRDQLRNEIKQRDLCTDDMKRFWEYAHGDDWEEVIKVDSQLILEVAESKESLYKDRLHEIKCPVLLTGSLADDGIPDIELGLCMIAKKIANSKIVLFSTGTHPLMWSRAHDFRSEVEHFIRTVFNCSA